MNSHCLPFRQIPHSTRLFLDYLDHLPAVQPFFPRSARFREWVENEVQNEVQNIRYPSDRRNLVADILERQSRIFGASPRTLENLAAFRAGALALVTGQQVGLFGGPAFAIYKALSAVKLAEEARRTGLSCVPIFWLATEDHDLEEVNQAGIPAADTQLERITSAARGPADAPVGTIRFGPDISETVLRVQGLLGECEAAKLLADCYRPGETFGTAFARFFSALFAEFGVILLDGSDAELDRIAAPLYRQVIEQAHELNNSLLERDQQLQSAGYHQQVRITSTSTPLFLMSNGSRVAVHLGAGGTFVAGTETLTQKQLVARAESSPHSFSPNVLLRPVIQDYLLPTVAYVGGAAEVAYFAQAAPLYRGLNGRITPIVPRFSATLVEAKPKALLERYELSFLDLLHGPEPLREKIGARLLDPALQQSFDQAGAAVERTMTAVRDALARLDKTLIESAANAESKMLYQLTNLRARAARAELRQSEVAERHARFLSNTLYPGKTLQEREVAGVYFLAKQGRELLGQLLEMIHPDCVDHQLVTL